jgi:hypothetical protein
MILKTVVTEEGLQELVNFLQSSENELARLVSSNMFRVQKSGGLTVGHEVTLEIGQRLSYVEFAPRGGNEQLVRPLDAQMRMVMDHLVPLFEILCQFSIGDYNAP